MTRAATEDVSPSRNPRSALRLDTMDNVTIVGGIAISPRASLDGVSRRAIKGVETQLASLATYEEISTIGAVDGVSSPLSPQLVPSSATNENISFIATSKGVIGAVAAHAVLTIHPPKDVAACSATHAVATAAPEKDVISAKSLDAISASEPADRVPAAGANQSIAVLGSDDGAVIR